MCACHYGEGVTGGCVHVITVRGSLWRMCACHYGEEVTGGCVHAITVRGSLEDVCMSLQ